MNCRLVEGVSLHSPCGRWKKLQQTLMILRCGKWLDGWGLIRIRYNLRLCHFATRCHGSALHTATLNGLSSATSPEALTSDKLSKVLNKYYLL